MNEAMVIVLILFVVLLFTGLPLYVNLGLTSFLYIFLTGTPPWLWYSGSPRYPTPLP